MPAYHILTKTPRYYLLLEQGKPEVVSNLTVYDRKTEVGYDVCFGFEQKSVVNRLRIISGRENINDKVPMKIVGAIYDIINKEFFSRQVKDFMVELVS